MHFIGYLLEQLSKEIELFEGTCYLKCNHSTPWCIPIKLEMGNHFEIIDMVQYDFVEDRLIDIDLRIFDFGIGF